MKILAIESSCDETAAAVVEDGRRIISSVINSQVDEHKLYGGCLLYTSIGRKESVKSDNPAEIKIYKMIQ